MQDVLIKSDSLGLERSAITGIEFSLPSSAK